MFLIISVYIVTILIKFTLVTANLVLEAAYKLHWPGCKRITSCLFLEASTVKPQKLMIMSI